MSDENALPLIEQAIENRDRLALVDEGRKYTYGDLLRESEQVASLLLGTADDLGEARIAFMIPPSFQYVAAQWGIWRAGGVAVPISPAYPRGEIEYIVRDSAPEIVLAHPSCRDQLESVAQEHNVPLLLISQASDASAQRLPDVSVKRRAMILYTSGTTSNPKGVVTTHAGLVAQILALVEAWGWSRRDRILNVLPLHHVHGIVNVLLCALWAGAVCELCPKFDAQKVWDRFAEGNLTLFMAVPTIYVKLIAAWEEASQEERRTKSEACSMFRLMVSGSAPLPVTVLNKWESITGHTLLERYGMTEIGMALSNPLRGERRPGFVGHPLPGVQVRLVDDTGQEIVGEKQTGEIQVRGPVVFQEYWNQPEATERTFQNDWFQTGDLAEIENGYFRILGRRSVDIVKTGGYKVSALEIEETLRTHPAVRECAVVGASDPEWGERICAAVVPSLGKTLALDELRDWAKEKLAGHKLPTRLLLLGKLPRNAMGKVVKPEVKKLFGEGREE